MSLETASLQVDQQKGLVLLREAIAKLSEGISVFDADLRLVVCNSTAVALSGIPLDRAIPGAHFRDLLLIQAQAGEFGPCDPEAEADRIIAGLHHSVLLTYERRRPNGRYVEVRRSPLSDGGFLTVYQDVTEKKNVKDELHTWKFAVNSIDDMVSVMSTEFVYTKVNDAWCRATGLRREAVLGQSALDVLPSVVSDNRRRAILKCVATGLPQVVRSEVNLSSHIGRRQVETTYYRHANADGVVLGVVIVARDLTEQTQQDARLLESARFIRTIVSNMPGLVSYWTPSLNCLFANSQYMVWFGHSVEKMTGIHMAELQGQESFVHDEPLIQRVLAGEELRCERKLTKATGQQGYLQIQYVPDWVDGTVKGFFFVATDITELKQTQADLEAMNVALRISAIAFEGQQGIVVADRNRKILQVNAAFTKIGGYSTREVLALKPGELRSSRYEESFFTAIWEQVQQTGSWAGDVWWRHKNGHDFPVSLTVTAVTDESGQVVNYVATVIEVTERYQREDQRRAEEIEQRNALVQEVHHRIKNNLQGVVGLLYEFSLAHVELEPVLRQAMGQVRSIATIHGLQGQSSSRPVDLFNLIRSIASQISEIWRMEVCLSFPADNTLWCIVEAETVPIALVLNELLANAAKHCDPRKPGIHLKVDQDISVLSVWIKVENSAPASPSEPHDTLSGSGQRLIASLLPREGALFSCQHTEDSVLSLLELSTPVIAYQAFP